MTRTGFLFVAALVLLLTASIAFSFDIAIYSDPLSYLNMRYFWGIYYNGYVGSYDDFMADTGYTANGDEWMRNVYDGYRDMGVTKVMVYYPYPDNFIDNDVAQDCTHIGVMNWFYPGLGRMHGAKYVDAQYRDVQVGNVWPSQNGYWSFDYSIGDNTDRVNSPGLPNRPSRPVVAITGPAGTMWRPQSDLGKFSGWDGLQTGFMDSSWFMPMHFKVTWAVDSDEPIDTTSALANFYWMVHTPSSSMYGYDNVAWWRFPARPIILPTQAQSNNWITTEFVDSANAVIMTCWMTTSTF
ncbi:hypothetical protein HZB60_04625 [candidate division KSB1 bacterium]|nr:hypothetical protein [candidate division KSB1 bacterium]